MSIVNIRDEDAISGLREYSNFPAEIDEMIASHLVDKCCTNCKRLLNQFTYNLASYINDNIPPPLICPICFEIFPEGEDLILIGNCYHHKKV